jgi:pyrroline-5-carboxylate reductase
MGLKRPSLVVAGGVTVFELGLIGYGSMGSTLLNGFLSKGVLSEDQVIVATRTQPKLDGLKKRWPGVAIAINNVAAARESGMVLIAVKPRDVRPVLDEIVSSMPKDAHLVLISAGVTIKNAEHLFPGKISKVIPSITMEVGEGIALVCHNENVCPGDAKRVERMFGAISTVLPMEEKNLEVAADLTSCAPGFFAAIIREFVNAGMRHGTLTKEEAEKMAVATFYGTAKLLAEKGMDFDEVVSRVATKGGITEEGVKVLRKDLPSTFDEVFDSTLSKYAVIKKAIGEQFEDQADK